MRRFVSFVPALIVLAAALAVLFVAPEAFRRLQAARTQAEVTLAQRTLDGDNVLTRMNDALRSLAAAVEPSVVHIDIPVLDSGRIIEISSSGSGWLWDDAGHIVTNAHVVRSADSIRVQFHDGRVALASLTGIDPFTDIAVLQVKGESGLVPVRRASGEAAMQGDRVFAFGSPFGFKFSMSEGIVSGLGRVAGPSVEYGGFSNYIQTDAAVNPGNSGGPLVDARGRVIGMNVAIATARSKQGTNTSEGQSSGISFAIPLATIESVVEQLIGTGKVSRGFLGILYDALEEPHQLADAKGKFVGTGLIVTGVQPDGPAAKAGLKLGDAIMTINGQAADTGEGLRSIVSTLKPGQTVNVRLWRKGQVSDVAIPLGELPQDTLGSRVLPKLGAQLFQSNLGPMIMRMMSGSPAEQAGLLPGMVIVKVGEVSITDVRELGLQLVDHGWLVGKSVELTVVELGEGFTKRATRVLTLPPVEP